MASFGVNPVSPEASKSWLLRKICPSWTGSKSTSHNHCDEVLVGKKPGRSINASRHDATPRRQRLLHHDLHGPVRLEVGHQRSNSAIVVGTNMLIGGLLKVSRLKGASVCAGGSSRFRAVAD